jgi:hypothetical protein
MAYCIKHLRLLNSLGAGFEQWKLLNAHEIMNGEDSNHSMRVLISPSKHDQCYAHHWL